MPSFLSAAVSADKDNRNVYAKRIHIEMYTQKIILFLVNSICAICIVCGCSSELGYIYI